MYKKTLIRRYFTAYLKANVLSVSNRVYSGRINPKEDENYPYLTIFTKDETVKDQTSAYTTRELELHIGVVVKNNTSASGDFYEAVEAIMYDVEAAMGKVSSVNAKQSGDNYGLINDIVFRGSTTEHDNSSSSDIGGALMTYTIEYDYELPIVPLVLENFDVDGSIDHIQITNEGIPINV